MDLTAIIVAFVGGGGGAALVKFLCEFIDKRRGQSIDAKIGKAVQSIVAPVMEKLDEQENKINGIIKKSNSSISELREIRLDTTRTQLIMLMEHQPHNYDTILKVAERYFCQLNGDWYCTSLFRDWAKRENITVPAEIHQATLHHE